MKKAQILILASAAGMLLFLLGLFTGRSLSGDKVRLTNSDLPAVSSPTQSTCSAGLNINTATKEQLMDLPGIGDVLAQRIVDYRSNHGPFSHISQLTAVEGIGEKTLENISDYITAGG